MSHIGKSLGVFLSHPFELCISIALILTVLQTTLTGQSLSGVVDKDLDDLLATIWRYGIASGSGLIVFGLFLRHWGEGRKNAQATLARLRVAERAGCLMVATTCFIYAVVLGLFSWPGAALSIGLVTSVGAGFVFRARALSTIDRAVLSGLRTLSDDRG